MSQQPPKPFREKRPWGDFIKFVENSPCTVKVITVEKGQSFSLQYHNKRDEFWYVISGNGTATIGDARQEIESKKEYFVPRETLHRIEAGTEAVVFVEISYGSFDEADIVRTEDRYGRVV